MGHKFVAALGASGHGRKDFVRLGPANFVFAVHAFTFDRESPTKLTIDGANPDLTGPRTRRLYELHCSFNWSHGPIPIANASASMADRLSGSNTGAAGAQNYYLPPATPGADFSAYVDAAQTINFDATGTDRIKNGNLTSIAGGKISSATLGNFVRLHCFVAGVWITTAIVGDWDLQTS